MANGTMNGEHTTCKKINEYCPEFYFIFHDDDKS